MNVLDVNTFSQPTYHLVQGWHGVRSTFSVVSVLWLIKMAALVIHAAALELAEEVEEAVFIGGITAQLLKENVDRNTFFSTNRQRGNHFSLQFLSF